MTNTFLSSFLHYYFTHFISNISLWMSRTSRENDPHVDDSFMVKQWFCTFSLDMNPKETLRCVPKHLCNFCWNPWSVLAQPILKTTILKGRNFQRKVWEVVVSSSRGCYEYPLMLQSWIASRLQESHCSWSLTGVVY